MDQYYWMRWLWVRLMRVGRWTGCHQRPERSFFFRGYQVPVCARCIGVLIGEVTAVLLFFCYRLPPLWCALIFGVLMLLDWGIQYLGIKESSNGRRLLTGFLGGLGCWTVLILGICHVISY